MNFLYSLYDALVSIDVPSDKARAVVDAMEQDMGTTLATKRDLAFHTSATKQDLSVETAAIKHEFDLLRRDIAALELRMTVKLGSMLFLGFGLMITALRLWG